MSGLEGQVAFITGAGRGQGRSHAAALAEQGVDIIAVDLCEDIDTVSYPLSTPSDLDETAAAVKAHGRRVVTYQADVRDQKALWRAVDAGLSEFDRLDIVLANAGIAPSFGLDIEPSESWGNIIDVNLTGVWNTVWVTKQAIIDGNRGGSIVITSSTAGLKGLADGSPGADAYVASKHGLVGLMRALALELAPHSIRVNTVHPTGVNTPMVVNEATIERDANGEPVSDEVLGRRFAAHHPIPRPWIYPEDVAREVVHLVTEPGNITGAVIEIGLGQSARMH